MNKYQNGKIYKLINIEGTLTYIGSTTQSLAKRKANHHSNYKNWINGTYHFVSSYKIFDDDEDGCQIVLLEAFPCETKEELEKRERYYIENNECVNKVRPTRTQKEYYEDNKDKILEMNRKYRSNNEDQYQKYQNQYREENKEKLQEQKKNYYKDNKDKINNNVKIYRENNKEKCNDNDKAKKLKNPEKYKKIQESYRERNKAKLQEKRAIKYTCECGSLCSNVQKLRHFTTMKHIDYMNSIKTQQDEIDKLEEEFNRI